jgi:hypothetical protein
MGVYAYLRKEKTFPKHPTNSIFPMKEQVAIPHQDLIPNNLNKTLTTTHTKQNNTSIFLADNEYMRGFCLHHMPIFPLVRLIGPPLIVCQELTLWFTRFCYR